MSRERAGWLAGAATQTFPVPIGTPLAGYMARTGPATEVHDELTVGALVLCYGDRRLAIVTADIAAVDAELVVEITAAAGIARSELAVCASHTHSGPVGVIPRLHPADSDRIAPELRATFIETCATTISRALSQLEPVDLRFGTSETAGLAANRNDADGPFDPRLSILATRRPNGKLSSVLVHFACHPTILGADSRLVSADFPGALRRSLRAALERDGHSPDVLFANGAAGDVSTRFTRKSQDVAEVERVGAGLAAATIAALGNSRIVEGPIRYERKGVTLTPRSLGETDGMSPAVEGGFGNGLVPAEQRKAETRAQGASLLARLVEAGPDAIRSTFDVEAWALGDVDLIAVPGELFASLGAWIAGSSPSPTLILGYANGYVGYLVDEAAYLNGTYEALASPFASGAGERVAEVGREIAGHVRAVSAVESGDE